MKLNDFSSLKGLIVTKGSVLKMTFFPSDGVRPKHEGETSRTKYFVVLGKDKDSILVGSLLINTDVNINLIRTIAPYQHCIYPKYYAFLGDKVRYVNCYTIKEIAFEKVVAEAEYIGQIREKDMEKIVELTNASPVNQPGTLKKFGVYIGE